MLVQLATLVTSSQEPDHLIEAVAETAKELLSADSLSVSRFDADTAQLHTLVNVGDLGPGEQRRPVNESYRVLDFPDTLGFLTGRPVRHLATRIDDPGAEPVEIALLSALGKGSSLKAAIVAEGQVWGELWAARTTARAPFSDVDGGLAEVIAALVSAGLTQATAFRQLRSMAVTDPLTGLANRRALDEHLVRHLARCASLGLPLAVVVADLNGLKAVNDVLGHAAGDQAIAHAADGAAKAIHGLSDALAARLGGDEFALVLPALDANAALHVARTWCTEAAHPTLATSIACGVAVFAPDREPARPPMDGAERRSLNRRRAEHLLAKADRAQYAAKRGRRPDPVLAPVDWPVDSGTGSVDL